MRILLSALLSSSSRVQYYYNIVARGVGGKTITSSYPAYDAHFTYYHYLIYDGAVEKRRGNRSEIIMLCTAAAAAERARHTTHRVPIMKSQEGRNLCRRRGDQVRFPVCL